MIFTAHTVQFELVEGSKPERPFHATRSPATGRARKAEGFPVGIPTSKLRAAIFCSVMALIGRAQRGKPSFFQTHPAADWQCCRVVAGIFLKFFKHFEPFAGVFIARNAIICIVNLIGKKCVFVHTNCMPAVAKVFILGNSQAIRLPKAFRVDVHEVWISKNEVTGEITLRPKQKPDALQALMKQLQQLPKTAEFIPPRNDASQDSMFDDLKGASIILKPEIST